MKNMTLDRIARVLDGQLVNCEHYDGREAEGVVLDSRLVQKDYLFFATVGERVDGHSFIPEVYEKGALAVICEKAPAEPAGPYILVESSLQALKELAAWYRRQLPVKVVGITGSVGKTSTKEFISSVLSQRYQVLKTEGNYNNEIGLPLTVFKIRREHEVAVLEMGISDFGEMHRLSKIAKPDIAVITNIGLCHLENLGDRKGVLKAKTEIFDYMDENSRVCLNGDDDMLALVEEVKGHKPIRFGLGKQEPNASQAMPEVYADDIKNQGLFGSTCTIHYGDQAFLAQVPLPGLHMILNALAATAVGNLLGLSGEEIRAGIEAVKPTGGRSNIIRHESFTIIDDCYNANPVSMRAAIDLISTADTRRVALLGDMFELGDGEKTLHYELGAYAAAGKLDVLICVGKLSSHLYQGAKDASFPGILHHYETRDELLAALPDLVRQKDTILVKASHGMGFDQVVKALLQ